MKDGASILFAAGSFSVIECLPQEIEVITFSNGTHLRIVGGTSSREELLFTALPPSAAAVAGVDNKAFAALGVAAAEAFSRYYESLNSSAMAATSAMMQKVLPGENVSNNNGLSSGASVITAGPSRTLASLTREVANASTADTRHGLSRTQYKALLRREANKLRASGAQSLADITLQELSEIAETAAREAAAAISAGHSLDQLLDHDESSHPHQGQQQQNGVAHDSSNDAAPALASNEEAAAAAVHTERQLNGHVATEEPTAAASWADPGPEAHQQQQQAAGGAAGRSFTAVQQPDGSIVYHYYDQPTPTSQQLQYGQQLSPNAYSTSSGGSGGNSNPTMTMMTVTPQPPLQSPTASATNSPTVASPHHHQQQQQQQPQQTQVYPYPVYIPVPVVPTSAASGAPMLQSSNTITTGAPPPSPAVASMTAPYHRRGMMASSSPPVVPASLSSDGYNYPRRTGSASASYSQQLLRSPPTTSAAAGVPASQYAHAPVVAVNGLPMTLQQAQAQISHAEAQLSFMQHQMAMAQQAGFAGQLPQDVQHLQAVNATSAPATTSAGASTAIHYHPQAHRHHQQHHGGGDGTHHYMSQLHPSLHHQQQQHIQHYQHQHLPQNQVVYYQQQQQ